MAMKLDAQCPANFAAVATECLVAANSPLRAALLAAWLCLDRARICDALTACPTYSYFCTTYSRTSWSSSQHASRAAPPSPPSPLRAIALSRHSPSRLVLTAISITMLQTLTWRRAAPRLMLLAQPPSLPSATGGLPLLPSAIPSSARSIKLVRRDRSVSSPSPHTSARSYKVLELHTLLLGN